MDQGFDFITGQVTAEGTAAPLTADTTARCERLYISNPGSTVVYIGKSDVTISGGYPLGAGQVEIAYSGAISDMYCISADSQVIGWLALK